MRGKNQAEYEGGSGILVDGGLQYASSLPSVSPLRHGSAERSDQVDRMVFEGGVPC